MNCRFLIAVIVTGTVKHIRLSDLATELLMFRIRCRAQVNCHIYRVRQKK